MRHPKAGRLTWFFNIRQWGQWGLQGPSPTLPCEWVFFLGPLAIAKVTTNEGTRWTRQRRRQLQRQLTKRIRKAARRRTRYGR